MQPKVARDPTVLRQTELFDAGFLAMMHVAEEWNHEVVRFVRHRADAYTTFAAALGACATPPAAALCYARFVTATWEEYAREALVMQTMARRVAEEAVLTSESVVMPVKAPVLE